jgi:histidyl-tRNA synthetase
LLDCKNVSCQAIAASAPKSSENLCPECAEHFDLLKRYLILLDLPFEINHCLVRGLDYYTKTVFEIQPEVEGTQSTIGGGGRYDDLIEELGGKPTPAIGFATGIERIIANLKSQGINVPVFDKPRVYIAYIGDEAWKAAIKLAADLRMNGIATLSSVGKKSLKAQLRQANSLGISHSIILGDEEIKSGNAVLRDMVTSQQQTIPLSQITQMLK